MIQTKISKSSDYKKEPPMGALDKKKKEQADCIGLLELELLFITP